MTSQDCSPLVRPACPNISKVIEAIEMRKRNVATLYTGWKQNSVPNPSQCVKNEAITSPETRQVGNAMLKPNRTKKRKENSETYRPRGHRSQAVVLDSALSSYMYNKAGSLLSQRRCVSPQTQRSGCHDSGARVHRNLPPDSLSRSEARYKNSAKQDEGKKENHRRRGRRRRSRRSTQRAMSFENGESRVIRPPLRVANQRSFCPGLAAQAVACSREHAAVVDLLRPATCCNSC